MHKLLREPLVHFLLLGVLLFGAYSWLHRGQLQAPNEIVVSRGHIESLRVQFERVWQRRPTLQELQGLVDSWVREEIFYREGMAMGLDRDDPVVRRRIAQKIEFIIDAAAPTVPTTEELQRWLDANRDKYFAEPTYSLRQVYFDPARHGEKLETVVAATRAVLERGSSSHGSAGDTTMLPSALEGPATEVVRVFGADFEHALRSLPIGGWQGPVRSGFGVHLIELRAREDGRKVTLDEVRPLVERDLLHARTQEANAAYYDRVRANYRVRIEDLDAATSGPSG